MTYFHFSIGPVQEFVGQARRTNDFWGGSFLLSWLAGVAMLKAEKQGAKQIYPLPPDKYLGWLDKTKPKPLDEGEGEGKGDLLAKVGAIPNRFCMKVDEKFDPNAVERAVIEAWQALAEHTRKEMFGGAAFSEAGQAVWQRQILDQPGGLWEIMWVIDDKSDPQALDERKHWRNHCRKPEGAPFCALMAGWQALPLTPEQKSRLPREDIDDINAVSDQNQAAENQPKEGNLCAPALIKRHFAKSFASFKSAELKGWTLPSNVPSTHYFAAAAWLTRMLAVVKPEELQAHENLAAKLNNISQDEEDTRLNMVEKAKKDYGHSEKSCALHAPYWFDNEIQNSSLPDEGKARLLESLRKLYQAKKKTKKEAKKEAPDSQTDKAAPAEAKVNETETIGKPGTHYAILLMDGDKMGEMLKEDAIYVAKALKLFTEAVPGIVDTYSGFLVYAGGDDVLALLPPQTALECANQLRQAYQEKFKKVPRSNEKESFEKAPHSDKSEIPKASISCALLYAHSKTPLTPLLSSAHHLLDQVAKHESGRDSIAIQIWKRSGLNLSYAQKWAVLFPDSAAVPADQIGGIIPLLEHLVRDAERTQKQVSTKFFQRAQDVMREMAGLYPAPSDDLARDLHSTCESLLKQEYRHGRPKQNDETEEAREKDISQLIKSLLSMAVKPQSGGNDDSAQRSGGDGNTAPQADFLALLKFLADNFQEKDEEGNA